jgi:adenosylcobinamide-phosphate synthase
MTPDAWTEGLSPAAVLLIAFLAETLVALPPLRAGQSVHPLAIIGRIGAELARRLDRASRGEGTRLVRGALLVLVFACLAGLAGWALQAWTHRHPLGWLADAAVLALAIELRGTIARAGVVGRALGRPRVAAELLADHFSRETDKNDVHAVARATIEASAARFASRVVGPAFWYLVLGLPGLLIHVVADAVSADIQRDGRSSAFGLAVHRFAEAFNAIPARLATPFLALAALATPKASAERAIRCVWRDLRNYPGFNDGWPVAAVAGALGLSLGPPDSWVNPAGRARADAADLRRARYLIAAAGLFLAAPIAALAAYLV